MKIEIEKSTKISTVIAFTTSILVTIATLGMAIFSLFFVHNIFGAAFENEFYTQTLLFQKSLQALVFAFLIFGLIGSYYMTRIILNPLLSLIKGTKEISEGNFKSRLKNTSYFEINELIKTYNKMAESLETLYKDLENKVRERTQELEDKNKELENIQVMLVHNEKMRSLGQLVAGITHEINNPVNFIYGNMTHLKHYSNALFELINLYESYEDKLSDEQKKSLSDLKAQVDLNFIKTDLPMLINSCYDGTVRTKNIIQDLRNFSRLDELVINSIDLPKEIDTTLHILNNKIKNRIEVIKEYDEELPLVEGYGGQINQVFMNILDNACYAIENEGKLYIRLQKKENDVIMEFEDTGSGIAEDRLEKIFEPFYTTKPVGEGTGLGLAISYQVIQKHKGTLTVESQPGKGTIFRIKLPIKMTEVKD